MPGKKPNETKSERVATIASKQLSSSKISADAKKTAESAEPKRSKVRPRNSLISRTLLALQPDGFFIPVLSYERHIAMSELRLLYIPW